VTDLQLNATANGGTSFPTQNAGDSRLQGLELETTWIATPDLQFFLNAAFMDGKYTRLAPGAAPAQAAALYGVTNPSPPQIPDYTFSLGFDYGVQVGPGKVKLGADWFKTDDYVVASTNDFVVKAYDRFNAFVGYDLANWQFRVSAKNLSNDATIVSGSRALGGFILLPPREWMATVTYRM
jgi:iron complex outermembrane receptor protein